MEKDKNANNDKPEEREYFPGYPKYPAEEDIYKRGKEKEFVEDESLKNTSRPKNAPGEDLDVPGSELDDAGEAIGEEDEENNYYSLDDEDLENEDEP